MMQGFSVIRQFRLEYDRGLFIYDVSRQQGGEGVCRFLCFSDKGGSGGWGISLKKNI